MNKKMVLDRIPCQFCEGPFWGNGKMGAVLYVQNGKLCISVDHVGLWELRETLPDMPKADFQEILAHKKEFIAGDPRYVERTDIFGDNIGRTRLPSLAVELSLPGEIASFLAETDMLEAGTGLRLEMKDGKVFEGEIWLDSCVNVLGIALYGEGAGELEVKALGWDLDSPRLKPLKDWHYEPCIQTEENGLVTVRQHFGGSRSAVLSAGRRETKYSMEAQHSMEAQRSREAEGLFLAVSIETGDQAEEADMAAAGTKLVQDYLDNRDSYLEAHRLDWKTFWDGFAVEVPNERLQEAFEQEMYKLYCNEREDSSPVTLQGVWNPNNRMPAWFGDLHNDLNVQSCYWPAYKTGNVKLVRPYIDYYSKAAPRFMERAYKLFGIKDAIHIPTMMAPDGTGAASEWCYWNSLLGPELFVAVDFTWFYEYSREEDTLRDKIYPFIEKVLHLYQGIAIEKEDGCLHIPFTTSPEVDRDGHMLLADDATFTLSCLHYLCRKMNGYAQKLQLDGAPWLAWSDRLVPVKTNEKGLPVYAGVDVFASHRHFCHLYPIYPLCEEAHNELAQRSLDTAINQGFLEFAAFSCPYLGIMAARCGRGNMSRTMLELYCMVFRSRNSFTVNGDPYQNGILRISDTNAGESSDAFTLESGFFIPTALCEMFVHRAKDTIWVQMGMPDEWKACSCRELAVEGGHRVTSEREDYSIRRILLKAGCEETLTLRWKDDIPVKRVMRNGTEMEGCKQKSLTLEVLPGEEFVIEFE